FAILESLGGGVAVIDYDGDGLLDIFLTGGGYYDGPDSQEIKGHPNRLYKNLGNGKFRDVTREVGLDQPVFYSHGAAVADYNRDGWPDLLVTGWGRMALYKNVPDGKGGRRFVEVTREAGLPENLWTTSAAFADFDGDGFADLYICQYVDWSWQNNPKCAGFNPGIERDVCPPKSFTGLPHKVFRNNGNGTFTDVSKEAGLRPFTGDPIKDSENGKGLGVVAVDVDNDTKPDLHVANDTVDHFLYLNKSTPGKIRFEEVGLSAGIARDDRGVPNGGMGTDAGDPDRSGNCSIWVTNYENEMHGLYRNTGRALFLFSTPASGIAAIGQQYVGFGTSFLDLDNHGWEDIVIANGHVIRFPRTSGLRQHPVLLRNKGNSKFCDITVQGGAYFRGEHIGRGLALADLDNKGRSDIIVSHLNEPAAVLRNDADVGQHWLGIQLVGKDHRDVVGAKVVVEAGEQRLTRFAKGGGSYLSSSDRRQLFGLGKIETIDKLTVTWPGKKEQHWDGKDLKVDRYWRLIEDKTKPEAPAYSSAAAPDKK
ncbi:MAG TPA: CRTAC1 family protein, partial [Pirellulales bacterium]|nr:CRTAC1 family protein [Pirellulales bacterium]